MSKLSLLTLFLLSSLPVLLSQPSGAASFHSMPDMVPVWKQRAIPAEVREDSGSLSVQFLRALNRAYPTDFLSLAENGLVRPVQNEQGKTIGDSLNYYQEAYVCGSDLHAAATEREDGGYVFAIAIRGQLRGSNCYSSALIFDYDPARKFLIPRPDHPWLGMQFSFFPAGTGSFFNYIADDGALITNIASETPGILSYLELRYSWNGRDYQLRNASLRFRKSELSSRIQDLKPDHMALFDVDNDGYAELFLTGARGSVLAVAGLRGDPSAAPDKKSFLAVSSPHHSLEIRRGMFRLTSGEPDNYLEDTVWLRESIPDSSGCRESRRASESLNPDSRKPAKTVAPGSLSGMPDTCRENTNSTAGAEIIPVDLKWLPLREIRIL